MLRTIEAHREEIAREPFGFFAGSVVDETPDIFVKFTDDAVYRIINAERMRECIKINNLTRLAVPKKYIYKLDDLWLVVIDYVSEDETRKELTLEEAQQLVLLVEKTGYSDWGFGLGDNIVLDKETGKITFIDTEYGSFSPCPMLFLHSLEKSLDKPTKQWLNNHIETMNIDPDRPFPNLQKFDNHNSDLAQVAKEYSEYYESQRTALLKKYNLEIQEDNDPEKRLYE